MVQSLLPCLYDYDSLGRLIRQEVQNSSNSAHIGRVEFGYDIRNNLTKVASEFGGYTAVDKYLYSEDSGNTNATSYAKDNLLSRYYIANSTSRYVDYTYDSLNRLTQKSLNIGSVSVNSNYSYKTAVKYNEGLTSKKYKTTQLAREILDNTAYSYYYDEVGNITDIKLSTRSALDTITEHKKYTYDNKNQLLSESITKKDANNKDVITNTSFTYDDIGNITKKVQSSTSGTKTINYRYGNDGKTGWNNLLTGVDLSGNGAYESTETISYDAIGNPTTYLGNTLTWSGRQLTSYKVGTTTLYYTYNSDGLRTSKKVLDVECNYHYIGDQLRYETRGDHKFYYFYDASGNLSAIRYYDANGAAHAYFALTNHQGDVVAFYNNNGVLVASYEYDAWGNCTITKDTDGIAALNPIRYRGYYYDSETGLYYLQSRYYNPQIGRFLNADGYITTGQGVLSYNMFAYCGNNPVMYSDPTGHFWNEFCTALAQTFQQTSGYFLVAAGVSQVDSLAIGPADIAAGVMILGGAIVCTGVAAYIALTAPAPAISIPKVEEKVETKPLPPSTVIYRYGGANPGNLTPKEKDRYSGLSFSTKPMPGAAMTTIEALNSTGVVYAIQDSPTHVSVRPVGATMEDWINAGSSSVWTQAVKSVVIKWDGGN